MDNFDGFGLMGEVKAHLKEIFANGHNALEGLEVVGRLLIANYGTYYH